MKDIIEKLKKALAGAENAKIVDELAASLEVASAELDGAKADAAKATKEAKAAEAARAKAVKDLEAKSGTEAEEVSKLKLERDKAIADRDAATTQVSTLRMDVALRDAARAAGLRDMDALAMLDRSGVSLDEGGKLVGADKALKMLKEAKAYLFESDNTTPASKPGTGPSPKPGDNRGTQPGGEASEKASLAKLIAGGGTNPQGSGWGPRHNTSPQAGAGFPGAATPQQSGAAS